MAEVRLERVRKTFGDTVAVAALDLDLRDGEFVVLLGPTGAGKTTTLRLIAGLEKPDAGRIAIAGADVTAAPPAARDVAMVFQQFSLYPHYSVFDNLAFPLRSPLRRESEERIGTRVREIATLLRIDHKLGNRATRLSGGEMQRAAIARALVHEPALLVADEPTGNLDSDNGARVLALLAELNRELAVTILLATHAHEVAAAASRVLESMAAKNPDVRSFSAALREAGVKMSNAKAGKTLKALKIQRSPRSPGDGSL